MNKVVESLIEKYCNRLCYEDLEGYLLEGEKDYIVSKLKGVLRSQTIKETLLSGFCCRNLTLLYTTFFFPREQL